MSLHLLTLIGVLVVPAVLPVIVQHVKQFVRWVPSRKATGSPWPLVTDLLAMCWVAVLWREGLLQHEVEAPEGFTIGLGSVVLLGLVVGAICTLGYDGFRKAVAGRSAPPQA